MTKPHANPEDLDLYALDALDGEEKQALEVHLAACPACAQQLDSARQRTALLGLSAPAVAPRPQVKADLLAKLKAEPKSVPVRSAPVGSPASQPASSKTSKKRLGLRFSFGFGIATAVLAFVSFELAKSDLERGKHIKQLQDELSQDESSMQAMSQVTAAPDSAVITLLQQPGGPPGQAHVMYNARLGMGVYAGQLAPVPAGKSYQLWLVPASGAAPVSAGLVNVDQQATSVIMHLAPGLTAKAFAVTLEPQGGTSQPTGPMVLIGAAT
jgi:anti-sigma-K factor RskA